MPHKSMPSSESLADDMLVGGEAIAVFMFGDKSHRKKVFNYAEKRELPIFRLGRSIYARKSTLLEWIRTQEIGQGAPASPKRGATR